MYLLTVIDFVEKNILFLTRPKLKLFIENIFCLFSCRSRIMEMEELSTGWIGITEERPVLCSAQSRALNDDDVRSKG